MPRMPEAESRSKAVAKHVVMTLEESSSNWFPGLREDVVRKIAELVKPAIQNAYELGRRDEREECIADLRHRKTPEDIGLSP